MKVSELEGAWLDSYVGKAEGLTVHIYGWTAMTEDERPYQPSADWAQGGPIIDREGISIQHGNVCSAFRHGRSPVLTYHGPTLLVAAMRCFVASKYGEVVEDHATSPG